MISQGNINPAGTLRLRHISPRDNFKQQLWAGLPGKNLPDEIQQWRLNNFPNLWRGLRRVGAARLLGVPHFYGTLSLSRIRPLGPEVIARQMLADYVGQYKPGEISFPLWAGLRGLRFERLDFGTASFRVVTSAGVNFIVDAFQNSVELEILKYHGIGTNNTAEASGDTALNTELTTQYNPDNTRATGSLTENGSNVYETVGTNTVDAGVSIVEHGILSQAATGGGTLLDRTVFATITLSASDSLQSTYDLTLTAGS